MRAELKQLGQMSNTTTVYVTHDYQEALALGDRIAVMREGELVQIGTPQEIWRRPADTFVGRALGQPEMNLLDAVVDAGDGGATFRLGDGSVELPVPSGAQVSRGDRVRVGLRPCDLAVTPAGSATGIAGRVLLAERLGRNVELTVQAGGEQIVVLVSSRAGVGEGSDVTLTVAPDDVHIFSAGQGGATGSAGGDTARLDAQQARSMEALA